MKTVIVLNTDQMGHGDPELGHKILANFLRKSPAIDEVLAIVLYNHGVKLIAEGSPVLGELKLLHDRGVDLLPCSTCLSFYSLQPAIGQASDMDRIMKELDAAEKVITL